MLDGTWRAVRTRDRTGLVPHRLLAIDVQRIEHRNLWVAYHNQKHRLRAQRGRCQPVQELEGASYGGPVKTARFARGDFQEGLDGHFNEYYLWHGTTPARADAIMTSGFRLNMSGKNRGLGAWGRGIYFAECSSKSDEYAGDGEALYKGIFAMLLCRVCCGKMARKTEPNAKDAEEALLSGEYDSVFGDREAVVGTYREFVVFRERQVYPEYAVLYRRVY